MVDVAFTCGIRTVSLVRPSDSNPLSLSQFRKRMFRRYPILQKMEKFETVERWEQELASKVEDGMEKKRKEKGKRGV